MSGGIAKDRTTGTYGDNLASMLRDRYGYGKAVSAQSAAIKGLLRNTTLAKPIIVQVAWEDNAGKHWIVACGYSSAMLKRDSYANGP